jgi:hypothetical protein
MVINTAGYTIYRGSNLEKNWFRNNPDDPSVEHLKYISTERGTRLIVCGCWGIARHINYFGDWLMVRFGRGIPAIRRASEAVNERGERAGTPRNRLFVDARSNAW